MTTQNRIKTVLTLAAVVMAILATSANAAVVTVPVADVTGSHGGNWAGTLAKMTDGSGMDTTVDPSDPSTWTTSSGAYQDEWQAQALLTGAANSKIAWCVFDLGSSKPGLLELYLWNVRESTGDRGTNTYNMYYSDSPTVPLPPAPPTNTLGSDYDFASGGWTLFNTSGALTLAQKGAAPAPADGLVDLGGISARYIGLEMLTNHGTTRANVGLAEVAFTANDDPNLPSVDVGPDMISWTGQAVGMNPNVVNNDTTEPKGDLTYLWTASPDGIGDPNLDVAITDANKENASVTITKTPTGDATVVTMKLAVTLEGKDPVINSMTIDVYDDSCQAAKAVGPVELDITDIDEDCITAFPDFAVMAATWLDDYTLTEAIPK